MRQNKIFLILAGILLLSAAAEAVAQEVTGEEMLIASPELTRNGSYLTAGMNLQLDALDLKSNQAVVYTPMIVNGADTLTLRPVGVYGRTAWYQHQRNILKPGYSPEEISVRYKKDLSPLAYLQNVDYAEWMNGSHLIVKRDFYGCAGCSEGETQTDLIAYEELVAPEPFGPVLIYQTAVAEEVKARELSGRAYVDFPVNQIVIYPAYRNNEVELGKIIATIDSVKNDPDITVTSIHIAGTASPEGPYENNVYLAKNRTIALKDYVTKLYNFPNDFIQTDYEPVDWKGLREWLEGNSINNREQILAIVNSDLEPYARNSKIKKDYPTEYQWLLKNVYPGLRHSDYRIEYQIRQYTTVEEIAEVMKTSPQKLSLSEMYRLASVLPEGSQEYNDVFETAVRMYPNDEAANLNAANAALERGDLRYAERYLEKAGNSAEADYARGMLYGLQGDYAKAIEYVGKAQSAGLRNVDAVLQQLNDLNNYNQNNK